jgi:EAL domain-containing protein (putative c-di-GMP-specific phosphodiesterase class I)/CheY-like chemotaxis protein
VSVENGTLAPGMTPAPTFRVMVVDDDAVIRMSEAAILRTAGYEVLEAASGTEALAALAAEPCDLMLLDVLMPDLDGPSVVRELQRNAELSNLPVIYVTGLDDSEFLAASLDDGVDDYVIKPAAPHELIARVKARLRGAQARSSTQAAIDAQTRADRVLIEEILRSGGHRAVFQPIVDLVTHRTVGYEALTRFDDGTRPDLQFARARRVGLGHDLELVTTRRSLQESSALPSDAYVSVNVSASFLVESSDLQTILRNFVERPVVLEITEHEEIDDYDAVRLTLLGLGTNVSLAIDDVGSGYASLRHLLRLAPRIVKLDMEWTESMESEDNYVGAIVALTAMAERMGARLVTEGIETEAQLDLLRSLGVRYGQGYLLGRPVPAAEHAVLAEIPTGDDTVI